MSSAQNLIIVFRDNDGNISSGTVQVGKFIDPSNVEVRLANYTDIIDAETSLKKMYPTLQTANELSSPVKSVLQIYKI